MSSFPKMDCACENRVYSGEYCIYYCKEKRTSSQKGLHFEKRKLEAMVCQFFKDGNVNLGDDEKILKQSNIVDQLVVEEMLWNAEKTG